MICPKCGNVLNEKCKYCLNCGYENKYYIREEIISSNNSNNYYSLIGLILSIVSFIIVFINYKIGIILSLVSLILSIKGKKYEKRKIIKSFSLILSIIAIIFTLIYSVLLYFSKIEVVLDNGEKTTIGNYFKDLIDNRINKSKVLNNWYHDNILISFDKEYKICFDKNNLDSCFIGKYEIDYGYKNGKLKSFSDNEYRYYTIIFNKPYTYPKDDSYKNKYKLEDGIILINKINNKKALIKFRQNRIELDLNR